MPLAQELLLTEEAHVIMGIHHLTSSLLAHSACVSTSRSQAHRSQTPWGCTMLTGSGSGMPSQGEFIISAHPALDCVPIGRPDIWRWVAGIRALSLYGRRATIINLSGLRLSTSCSMLFMEKRRPPIHSSQASCT